MLLGFTAVACAAVGIEVELAGAAGSGGIFYGALRVVQVPKSGDGVTSRVRACPASHPHVTGGSAEITGDQSDLDLELKSSGPVTGGHGPGKWHFDLTNSSHAGAQGAVGPICARGSFRYPQKRFQIGARQEAQASVACPRGTKLAGGGVLALAGDHRTEIGSTAPQGNSRHPRAWAGTVNNGANHPIGASVLAVCAEHGRYTVVHSAEKRLPNNSQVSATASCPAGSADTGGGVRITGLNDGLEVAGSEAFDSDDPGATPDEGWLAIANNDASGRRETMQTFAVCRS